MRHKVGDTVRIQSQEWVEAQEKDNNGDIDFLHAPTFFSAMFRYAGKIAKIAKVYDSSDCYRLDVDNGKCLWTDQMFDPDYRPEDEPLSAEDAIHAMVENGEKLYDEDGWEYFWDSDEKSLAYRKNGGIIIIKHTHLTDLYRRPAKRTLLWTRWEILAWANSDESRGWLIKSREDTAWYLPQFHAYNQPVEVYQRARLLPDHSGIDEDTIQGFEVEE
jgi:hypothetical protein